MLAGNACAVPPPPNLALTVPVTKSRYDVVIGILALAASPDGRYVAYARSHSVALMAPDGREIAALPVRSTPTGLSFDPGSNDVLVMTASATYLWKPFSAHPPLVIPQPSPPVDVALSISGDRLVTANGGVTVSVWNSANGSLIRTFRPPGLHPSTAWDPAPLRVAISGDADVVASGNSDGTVSFWDMNSGKRVRDVTLSYSQSIVELRPTADGTSFLAVDYPRVASGVQPPGTAEVLNAKTGRVIATYQSPGPTYPPINPGATLSPDGNFLLAGPLGLAPAPPGGIEAAYQSRPARPCLACKTPPSPSPRHSLNSRHTRGRQAATRILVGTAIYSCNACGTLTQLKDAATVRIAWSQPLSETSDHPPATSPYD